MRIPLLALALVAASALHCLPLEAAEPAATKPRRLTGAEWQQAARVQAQKEATSPASAAAIERTRISDPDAGPSDSIDVIGIDDGKAKRGQTQQKDGGPVTWIDDKCFYASPPSMFEPGAATRLWMPTCKPGSPRVLAIGRTPKARVLPVADRPSAPAGSEISRANTADPR